MAITPEQIAADFDFLAANCPDREVADRRLAKARAIRRLAKARAIRELIDDRDDLQRTFNVMWASQMRAIQAWQQKHDEPDAWPDHAVLVGWLLEERDALRKALDANVSLLSAFVGPGDEMGQAVLGIGRAALAEAKGEAR